MTFKIESPRLLLRNYLRDDWDRVHIYASIPEFSQYELWGPNSEEDSRKFVEDCINRASTPDRYIYDIAICLKDSGLLIGGCTLRREAQQSSVGALGWAVNPEFQSQGYATEAATQLINYGFGTLKLKVIYATCDTRNKSSMRVMEKLGMKQVGMLKGHQMQKGYLRDTFRYELSSDMLNK